MSDLISRQEAIDALNKLDVSDGVGISSVACDLQKEAICSIENLPSVDAEPVKHGRWIRTTKADCVWECSACGYGLCDNRTTYCYDCGARMDGEE